MQNPTLSRYDAPERPRAVILMLHGGKERSSVPVDGRSASWRRSAAMARSIAGGANAAGASVWLARYRQRGWNGGADRTADARWALDQVAEAHGELPVVLLGHSMGARVAVHTADHPTVVGVVGLAPWWPAHEPVEALAGKHLVAAHGRRDRITSHRATVAYVERARRVAASAELHDMGPAGHYMITRAGAWNDLALTSSLEMLEGGNRSVTGDVTGQG